MPKIVIVGAGISGLAAAYRLRQLLPRAEIQVLERENRPGGAAWTLRDQGFLVETGPNGFLDTKPTTLQLCRDVGLGARLIQASETSAKNRYLFLGDRLRLLPGSLGSFLKTGLLSWRGKLGLLLERMRRASRDEADESIASFARRRAGREAAEVFADALVTGIYAGDPELLSVRACFPRLVELERAHGSILKGMARAARQRRAEAAARGEGYERPGKMWSCREGLGSLADTIVGALERPPQYGVAVRGLRRGDASGWVVRGDGAERWPADAVLLACPAHQQAGILGELDPELAERVGSIPYNRIAVVALGFRKTDVPQSLDGFGFIAPQRLKRDLLGVQWCSSIYPDRAPAGAVLVRALCGGWQRAEMVGWDDDRLIQSVLAELRLAMGIVAAPIFVKIIRWERAIPQYHVGHLERVAWIGQRLSRHSGLFLGGNAYHGVALNDCTEQGGFLAEKIRDYVQDRNDPIVQPERLEQESPGQRPGLEWN